MLVYLLCCSEVVLQHGTIAMVDLYSRFVLADPVCLCPCADMREAARHNFGDNSDGRG
jgi:hypothetical protein